MDCPVISITNYDLLKALIINKNKAHKHIVN